MRFSLVSAQAWLKLSQDGNGVKIVLQKPSRRVLRGAHYLDLGLKTFITSSFAAI